MLTKKENIKNEFKTNKNGKNSMAAISQDNHNHGGGCCQPSSSMNSISARNLTATPSKHSSEATGDKKNSAKTRITVQYDVGFSNQLYIRGKGANLSWDKGQPLKNVNSNEWIWETDLNFSNCEFKVLINDKIYENGDNHQLHAGTTLLYTPQFP